MKESSCGYYKNNQSDYMDVIIKDWKEKFQINKSNKIASLYPSTKLWLVLFYIIATNILSTIQIYDLPLILIPNFLFLLIIAQLSGIGKKFIIAMKKVFFLALAIFLLQTFIITGGELLFHWGILKIYQVGLYTGTKLSLMVLNIAGIFVWFFQTTEEREITLALDNAGVHHKVSFVFISSMQMIDVLGRNSKIILDAQRARGVETEGNIFVRLKAFIPSLIPLVLSAIIDNEDKVLTLEARGFNVSGPKTHILEMKKTDYEVKALIIGFALLLCVIIGRMILWKQL